MMLGRAGLIQEVLMSSANGLPLGAETNPKFRKFLFLDPGLMLRIQGLDMGGGKMMEEFILSASKSDLVNKGALAEMFVGLELIKNGNPRIRENLYYWENLNRGASAEVDYLSVFNMKVLPIEVKSGVSGKMKSLRMFMENKSLHTAIRTSLENFGRIQFGNSKVPTSDKNDGEFTINIIPLYAIYNYLNILQSSSL